MTRSAPAAVAQVLKTIAAPADKVWEILTAASPAEKFFMGASVDSDYRVGSPITFKGEYEGKAYEDRGQVLEVRPQERLSFSHYSAASGKTDTPDNYHTVTFELQPQGDATTVTLTQANLTGGVSETDRQNRAELEKNWARVLDRLSRAVAN